MKKTLCLILAVLMLMLNLAACGQPANKDRLAEIKARGYLEFCTEPYFAPMEFIDPAKTGDDQFVGVDIEIAKYIAQKMGVQLKIVPLDFTPLLAAIADGKYDLALSAIAYSPSRAEAMKLSKVYRASNTGYGFIVRAEDKDKYTTIEITALNSRGNLREEHRHTLLNIGK